ncbi:hypothetical protein BKA93DRAFT_829257 [Sparassis latifolia]|uniref:F-box domain-containing protein n=1 Tax=Sparassis crispa TaxID=139825 RepID=A0A401H6U6_9APHY|nr:hypothetical protein SCP_1900160 [Sparassis crispa]GBE90167.1 hypothetical protein SCP_1900160 [Sparassis crispa]
MVKELPMELIDNIVDHLWDDKPSLCRCALVSPTWLRTSRYHLYRGNACLSSSKNLESLVAASKVSHVAASLRSMGSLCLEDGDPAWVHRFPLVLGRVLSEIQELHIFRLTWEVVVMHPDTLTIGLMQFHRVTQLGLFDCSFRNFRQLQRLICALPQLRDLRISRVSSKKPSLLAAESMFRPPPLTDVFLYNIVDQLLASDFLDCLVYPSSVTLRSLRLEVPRKLIPRVVTVLDAAKPSLEHLHLILEESVSASDLVELDVRRCTALRRLDLTYVHRMSLADILRLVPDSGIGQLWISMRPGSVKREWQSASNILGEKRFSKLHEFGIRILDESLSEEEKQQIKDGFEVLRGRGVKVVMHFD